MENMFALDVMFSFRRHAVFKFKLPLRIVMVIQDCMIVLFTEILATPSSM